MRKSLSHSFVCALLPLNVLVDTLLVVELLKLLLFWY